jgi:hypothetical protein
MYFCYDIKIAAKLYLFSEYASKNFIYLFLFILKSIKNMNFIPPFFEL